MKRSEWTHWWATPVLASVAALGSLPAAGQGTLNFATRVTGAVDARVYYAFGGDPLPADGRFVAQLLLVDGPDSTIPLGSPVPL